MYGLIVRVKLAPFRITAISLTVFLWFSTTASGWYDETHLAIAQAAGYKKWFHAAGPDLAKIKAGTIERYNHYYNNNAGIIVTPELVMHQVKLYNHPYDSEGHLYGAIIAALRDYIMKTRKNVYAEYYLSYAAHYIGDLSQPLHNIIYDVYNRTYHAANDGIVNTLILTKTARIRKYVYPIHLDDNNFERDLAAEISRIANISRSLGMILKKEERTMTDEEAFRQLGHSVSLFQAVLKSIGRIQEQGK